MDNERATIGGNNPPDPIDTITEGYDAERAEAENWLDGEPVENEAQMNEVDALRKAMRDWRIGLEKGQKAATAPLLEALNTERDRWKPTITDAQRIEKGLVAAVDEFKRKLAEEQKAKERAAWDAAQKSKRDAEAKAQAAGASDLQAQREADAAKQAAIDAEKVAQAARKNQTKGLRTVTRYEVESYKEALNDIAQNDREATIAFIDEYVRRNHKARNIKGVKVWQDREAY